MLKEQWRYVRSPVWHWYNVFGAHPIQLVRHLQRKDGIKYLINLQVVKSFIRLVPGAFYRIFIFIKIWT